MASIAMLHKQRVFPGSRNNLHQISPRRCMVEGGPKRADEAPRLEVRFMEIGGEMMEIPWN